jgi:hypothetical protein
LFKYSALDGLRSHAPAEAAGDLPAKRFGGAWRASTELAGRFPRRRSDTLSRMMPVSFLDLQLAFEFVSSGGTGENQAYLDRQSGKIYWHSEFGDNDEELPDDIDDKKYILIPDKRELDLGKALVLDFAREFLPDDYGAADADAVLGDGDAVF